MICGRSMREDTQELVKDEKTGVMHQELGKDSEDVSVSYAAGRSLQHALDEMRDKTSQIDM